MKKFIELKGVFIKKIIVLCGLMLCIITISISAVDATTVSSGDLGYNHHVGTYILDLNVPSPNNLFAADLVTKYGLWDSPDVPLDIYFNNNLVDHVVASSGYITPGPQFNTSDITGLLLNGLNEIKYVGSSTGSYVIGQVDINYNIPVPLPGAFWLLGSGLLGLTGWRRFRKS